MSKNKEPFADMHGLEGLYVFLNHPARVGISDSHYPIFQRLMNESAHEIQERRAQSVRDAIIVLRDTVAAADSGSLCPTSISVKCAREILQQTPI
jgi:hypothetical protein